MKKKSIIFTSILIICIVICSSVLSALTIGYSRNLSDKDFSIDNLLTHIQTISQKEHSVFDQENLEEVRQYILSELNSYGVVHNLTEHFTLGAYNAETQQNEDIVVKNIYAEIQGTSGTNILLLAHYDSSPYKVKYGEVTNNSHGAFDDGYGVSTLLEIARLYANEPSLVNGIKIAFLDAEEIGMVGADAVFNYNSTWLNDVNLVVNVESRGHTGPVFLFETSENNSKMIEFYKNAGFPYTFSASSEVYGMMPNGTDLTVFIENGFNCLNLATLDDLEYYHNENDNYNNIDKHSVASYCNTLLPLVDEYTTNADYSSLDYFESNSNSVFFTLLPNVLITYSNISGWLLIIVGILLLLITTIVFRVKKKINFVKILLSLIFDLLSIGTICGIGFAIVTLLCKIFGINYHFMFVASIPFDTGILIILSMSIILSFFLITKMKNKIKINSEEIVVGALFLDAILCIVCSFVLFGGTFMFVFPLILFSICLLLKLIKNEKLRNVIMTIIISIFAVVIINLFVNVVYAVYVALSFGALGVLLTIVCLPLIMIVPLVLGIKFHNNAEYKDI